MDIAGLPGISVGSEVCCNNHWLAPTADPTTGRSAGPLWIAALYIVASTVALWSSPNGVEQFSK